VTDTVLVVDDSTFIVEGLVALLKKKYRAIPSFGGEECLQILLTEIPSVIILDIMMEPMDGWETLSRIKANPRTRHIPVLMFSAKQISFEEAEAHRIRIDDFLTKPVNPKELLSAVARILERQRRKRRTLSCWTASGVPPEKIDEYLTLSSNFDIDTSLLEVMKKLLAHPSITELRREELTSSLLVLEERIRGTGLLIEAFLHDYDVCVPGDNDLPEISDDAVLRHEFLPVPQNDDNRQIPPDNSAPESHGNDAIGEKMEVVTGITPVPDPGSPELNASPQPDGNLVSGDFSVPATNLTPKDPASADLPASMDKEIPGTASPEEVPEDLHSPAGQDRLNPDIQITPSPESPPVNLSEPGDAANFPAVRGGEPVPGYPSAEVPSRFEKLFESAPRPEDHSNVVHPSGSPGGVSRNSEGSPSPDPVVVPLPVPEEDVPPRLVKDTPPVNPPVISARRPDAKVMPVPAAKAATGSSGRGILAVLFRILFGRRG
jgi:two-component system, OmpR family, response regulator